MKHDEPGGLLYQRQRFVTRLSRNCLYTPSHYWLTSHNGIWRVGLTRFATRMLGEIVDYGFEAQPGAPIQPGQVIGWVEGFKTVSEIPSTIEGRFNGWNSGLEGNTELIDRDCYNEGWLYEASGQPGSDCLDVEGYQALLDRTIDQLAGRMGGGV